MAERIRERGDAGPDSVRGRRWWTVIVAGCVISATTMGVRSSFGLFTDPLTLERAWSRDVYSLAMALQNLGWGLGTPLAGMVADRFGPARVFAAGGALYALGLLLMPLGTTPLALHLTAGVLVGLGQGAASYLIVLSAFSRLLPAQDRPWALGIGTAAGSAGQFVIVPLGQVVIGLHGWQASALFLAGMVGLVPLCSLAFARRGQAGEAPTAERTLPALQAIRQAVSHRSYVLLGSGFFVCGFQLAFITIHLPPYLNDVGGGASLAAWAIATIGLFNMFGAYGSGVLSAHLRKSWMLSAIYLGRALAIAAFITIPVSTVSTLLFAAAIGVLWLSTAPPTSGLVAGMFGTGNIATLFGLVFLSHQCGSFLGVWLGGVLYRQTGSYTTVWWLTVALGVFAALVHLPISERRAPQLAPT